MAENALHTTRESPGHPTESEWGLIGRLLSNIRPGHSPERLLQDLSSCLDSSFPHDVIRLFFAPTRESWRLDDSQFELGRFVPPFTKSEENLSAMKWVYLNCQPLLRANINSDLRFTRDRRLVQNGWLSNIYVPLSHQEEVYGVLHIASRKADEYTEAAFEGVRRIFAQEEGHLFGVIQLQSAERVSELSTDMRLLVGREDIFEDMLQHLHRVGYDRARVYVYDKDSDILIGAAQVGIDHYDKFKGLRLPVGEDAYTQQTLESDLPCIYRWGKDTPSGRLSREVENPKFHDWAEIPLYVVGAEGKEVVGKISLDNRVLGGVLKQEHLDGLMGFASSAAVSIRQALLYESEVARAERSVSEGENRLRQQEVLLRVSNVVQGMSNPEDLAGVLGASLDEMRLLGVPADAMAIHRVMDEDQSLVETHRAKVDGTVTVAETRRSEQLCALWLSGGADCVDTIDDENRAVYGARFGGISAGSLLDLSFSLGVISVYSGQSVAFRDADVQEMLRLLAEVIALGAVRTQDLRRAETAQGHLRSSEDRLRKIVDGTPVCIHEIDLEGHLMSMNPAGLRMMGVKDESEIVGSCYVDVVNEIDQSRVQSLQDRAFRGESSFFEFKSKTGRDFESSFIPLPADDG